MDRIKVDAGTIIRKLEKERYEKIRKHNDQLIEEIAGELQKSLKAKRKADLTTIKFYLKMLELRLK